MDSEREVRSLGVDGAAALQLLNVEERAAAASCAAVAFVIAQEFLGARFVEVERIIVEEFFTSAEVAQGVNEYAIPFPDASQFGSQEWLIQRASFPPMAALMTRPLSMQKRNVCGSSSSGTSDQGMRLPV